MTLLKPLTNMLMKTFVITLPTKDLTYDKFFLLTLYCQLMIFHFYLCNF